MNPIRTIFLDFGNVIAYFSHERAVERLVGHTDVGYESLYRTLYRHARFNALESGRIDGNTYVGDVMEEGRLQCAPEFFRATFADIFAPNPSVCALVPRLAESYRLVLASNTNELHATWFLRAYETTFGHFQKLVLSHEIKARKPEAGFFARCQEWADAPPGQCLFVDDRADNIAAAQAHGWNAIQYTDFEALQRGLREFGV